MFPIYVNRNLLHDDELQHLSGTRFKYLIPIIYQYNEALLQVISIQSSPPPPVRDLIRVYIWIH